MGGILGRLRPGSARTPKWGSADALDHAPVLTCAELRRRARRTGTLALLLEGADGHRRLHEEVRPPILRPACLIRLAARRPLLAIAHERDPGRGDAPGDELLPRDARPVLSER